MRWLRLLAVVTTIGVYGQIVLGGVVRITGSGLGCRDWPLCYQHESDRFAYRTLLEVAHRLFGTATGLLVVATVAVALLLYLRGREQEDRLPGRFVALAAGLLGLYGLQAVLGGVTVLTGNTPWTVAMHLGNSLLVLAAALALTLWSLRLGRGPAAFSTERVGAAFGPMLAASTAAIYLVVLSGAYVVGTGAGGACTSWPLCGAHGGLADIHFLHRIVVTVAGLLLLRTIHLAQRRWRGTPMVVAAYATALGLLLEVAVGAAQVLLSLPASLRAAHLALATAVWAGTVLMAVSYRLESSPRERVAAPRGRLGAAGAS